MDYIVIEKHETEFDIPIILKAGDKVIIGKESSENWLNWVFCTKTDNTNAGWVPKQIIKYENDFGVILEDYSAKELNVEEGTILEKIKELNGWLWSKNKLTGEIGWVPLEKIKNLK